MTTEKAIEELGLRVAEAKPRGLIEDDLDEWRALCGLWVTQHGPTILAALRSQAAEPVLWRWKKRINCGQGQFTESHWIVTDEDPQANKYESIVACEPLYAAPRPAVPKMESPSYPTRSELEALVVSAPNARWKAWAQRRLDNFIVPSDGPWPATGLEPRGCPMPGACACPIAAPEAP